MGPPEGRPAIFLDRDGVLNEDLGYVYRLEDLRLIPGVPAALAALKNRGYLLIVVSNQSGVARGLFSTEDVERFHAALNRALLQAGSVAIDAFYYCPHHPEGRDPAYARTCLCRKPGPGMVQEATRSFGIATERSYLVGDKPDDIECAVRAGVTGIQVARAGMPRHPAALQVGSLALAVPVIREQA